MGESLVWQPAIYIWQINFLSLTQRSFYDTNRKLEYLAVYGRASIGDYYGCAFRVLAAFR